MLGAVDSVRIPLFSPFVPTGSGFSTRHRVHHAERTGDFPYPYNQDWWTDMSQLTAVDISDSDRFELAEVLKEESESNSAPRLLEDILQETCDDDFDPMSQRSCYELLSAYIARPTATIVSKNGHSSCSNCGTGIPYHTRFAAYCLGCGAVFSI